MAKTKMSMKKMEMSKQDKKQDMAMMKMHKSKVKSAAQKALGGKY